MNASKSPSGEPWSGLIGGLVLIAVGFVFLMSKLDVVDDRVLWRNLPWFVMLVLGGTRLLAPGRQRVRSGLTMMLIGTWGLVSTHGWGGLAWGSSWPLLLIGFGLLILLDGVIERQRPPGLAAGFGATPLPPAGEREEGRHES